MKVRYTYEGTECLVNIESIMFSRVESYKYKLLLGFYGCNGYDLELGCVLVHSKECIMEELADGKVVNLDEYLMKS